MRHKYESNGCREIDVAKFSPLRSEFIAMVDEKEVKVVKWCIQYTLNEHIFPRLLIDPFKRMTNEFQSNQDNTNTNTTVFTIKTKKYHEQERRR